MKRTQFKLTALLMALILTFGAASCGGTTGSDETTSGDTTEPVTEKPTVDSDGYKLDSLPELDFKGATVQMFVPSTGLEVSEFEMTEQTGDVIDDAVWEKNTHVADRLKINFEYTTEPGGNANRFTFADRIKASIMAGDRAYDICAGYSMSIANLAAAEMLTDLNSLQYLDFSQPWWSDGLLTQATVNDKLYFASGDISTNLIYNMYCVYFNKTQLKNYNLDEPYDLVLDGKWTLDKLIEMSKGKYQDLNGDSQVDWHDAFGCEIYKVYIDMFYQGSGLRTTDDDENGLPVISKDYSGQKVHDLVVKLAGFMHDSGDVWASDYDNSDPKAYFRFEGGNILFSVGEVALGANMLRDAKFDYGILPVPKYDESQENYCTIASFPYILYGIPKDAKDPDMSAAVIEALGSEAYRTTSPALFEVALKVKYSSDDQTAKMYDIIRGSMSWDFGRIFNDSLSSLTWSMFRNAVSDNNTNWASVFESNKNALETKLAAVVEAMK